MPVVGPHPHHASHTPLRARRVGDAIELAMVRDAHAFLAGRTDPVWFRSGARVSGMLVRVNPVMRRVVVALPEGLATFHEEDVEAV